MPDLERACRRHGSAALAAMIALYALTYSILGALQYRFYTAAFDLPIFAQAMEGMLHGRLHGSIRGMNWLGDHSSLILFLLAPLYALFRHPLTLVVVQSVALGLGAIPVERMARRLLGRRDVALAFAALYLAFPAVGYSNLFEFHPEVLCTPLLLATFDALEEGRGRRAIAFAALSLLGKEDVAFVVMGMALWSVLMRRRAALPLAAALILMSAASLALSFGVLKPRLNAGEANYFQMYALWGRTPRELVARMLHHPIDVARAYVHSPTAADTFLKRAYWIEMLAPLLFLPLCAPLTFLIPLPIWTEHFLSNRAPQHTIVCQYTALVTPFVIAAAILGLRNISRSGSRPWTRPLVLAALLVTLAANLVYGSILGLMRPKLMPNFEPVVPSRADFDLVGARDAMMRRADHPDGVVAGFEYLERFLRSPRVHSLHHVVLGLYTYSTRPYPIPTGVTVLIGAMDNPYLLDIVNAGTGARLRQMIAANRLVPVASALDNVLFVRDAPDSIELVRFGAPAPRTSRPVLWDGVVSCLGFDPPAPVRAGEYVPIRTYWRRSAPTRTVYSTELLVSDARDSAWVDRQRMIGYLYAPVADWPEREIVRETYRLLIPKRMRPGRYAVQLRLERPVGGQMIAARPDDPDVVDNDSTIVLGAIVVRPALNGRGP